jgi:heme exporter protein A
MLNISELTFERNDISLFTDLNCTVQSGSVLQITGANGAGKTTLLRILCGLNLPSSGEITWYGKSILDLQQEYFSNLCYIGHQPAVKNNLTVHENLQMMKALAQFHHPFTFSEILNKIGLDAELDIFAGSLSSGQQRRLAFAKLLLVKSNLWILDEPFASLDQAGCDLLQTMIEKHIAANGMVILTSHQAFQLKKIQPQILSLQ